MKINILFFALICIFFVYPIKAQDHEHEKWFVVVISPHGTVDNEGVKANCMITKCNGEDVMLLELINTNNHAVKCEWLHAPIDKNGKQHYMDNLQTIELKAGEKVTGKCGGAKQLIVNLSDYSVSNETIYDYYGSNFNVIKK